MAIRQPWLQLSDGLEFAVEQLREEGRLLPEEFVQKVQETLQMEQGEAKNAQAKALFEAGQALPYAQSDKEPSSLEGIRRLSKGNKKTVPDVSCDLYDRIYGAWLARCAGCLLGKPVEGWRTPELHTLLRLTDNYPLSRYLRADVSDEIKSQLRAPDGSCLLERSHAYIEQVDGMPEDDDTNYTLIGLKLVETYGRDFTPADVCECWMQNLPILHLCTAERVAYRNMVMGLEAPDTASFCNGYREWIGAQIRADLFGYCNPGDPRMAAEMAWRDACISHVKNGIYGEMWVAAMLAEAFVTSDMRQVLQAGLREIPSESRLTQAVEEVLCWKDQGIDWQEAHARIASRWDEYNQHHWCHTISNAQIVSVALLFGELDLEKTLSLAVMPGFDTDCNAATAGSVLGMLLGAKALPEKWIAPLQDTLLSGVDGFGRVRISDMARRTLALIEQ